MVGLLSYLPRRWIWGAILLVCCMGLVSMFEEQRLPCWEVQQRLDITSTPAG